MTVSLHIPPVLPVRSLHIQIEHTIHSLKPGGSAVLCGDGIKTLGFPSRRHRRFGFISFDMCKACNTLMMSRCSRIVLGGKVLGDIYGSTGSKAEIDGREDL